MCMIRTGLPLFLLALLPALWAEEEAAETAVPPTVIPFTLTHDLDADGTPGFAGHKAQRAWEVSPFDHPGAVRMDGDAVVLEKGEDMTGIRWAGPLRRMDYEITLEARRLDGMDFFCGLTFPVGDAPCSLIVGGWGGRLVGISSLDFQDAYNNETARFMDFETGRWYRIRLRVTKNRIQAWIDDAPVVDVDTTNRTIGIRAEVERSRPLGIATWRTTGAIRRVRLEAITEDRPQ